MYPIYTAKTIKFITGVNVNFKIQNGKPITLVYGKLFEAVMQME